MQQHLNIGKHDFTFRASKLTIQAAFNEYENETRYIVTFYLSKILKCAIIKTKKMGISLMLPM